MRVRVRWTGGELVARFQRFLSASFRFDWAVTQDENEDDAFIKQLAAAVGEYFRYENSRWESHLKVIRVTDVEPSLSAVFDAKLREIENAGDECTAAFGESFFEITRDGRRVGYVVPVDDDCSGNPLWDGSGHWLYYNANGVLVRDVAWSG